MPISAQLANLVIGQEPPANPTPSTRWISTSARHLQVPHTPFERTPIIGSYVGNTSATQEISPWYNPTLQRYECLVNTSSSQYFWYANSPLGPWSGGTKVLGSGSGGEAGNCPQTSVYVENGVLWAFYYNAGTDTSLRMAHASMPTTPGAVPVFTYDGVIYTGTAQILDSSWIIKVNGVYYLFTHSGTNGMMIATSSATSPAGFVASPFTAATTALRNLFNNLGVRYAVRHARPQVFYENGTWILFQHELSNVDSGLSNINRYTCNDPGLPINWVHDGERPFMEQLHFAEIDQVADFRIFQGANERWWAAWTGISNQATQFTIMAAPMYEPMLAYDGFDWNFTNRMASSNYGPGYINPDHTTADVITGGVPSRVSHLWDIVFRTQAGSLKAQLCAATAHAKLKITNAPTDVTSTNLVHLLTDSANDKITDGNPVTSMTRVGAVVTVAFRFPHGYDANDFICVSGATPSAYNTNSQAITSVVDAKTITYTLGADPGANTVLGAVARSVRPGESRAYKCRIQGIWVRD